MTELKFFVFSILIVLLVVGCNDSQSADEVDLYNEVNNSEDIEEEIKMPDEEIVTEQHQELNADDCLEEYLEQWWAEFSEQREKNHVDYILSGSYTPADRDIDLHRIERFVFSYLIAWPLDGYGLIIDRAVQGRVYYGFPITIRLDNIEISAEFKEDDLNRLIRAIEESGLRDWDEHYQGEFFGDGGGGSRWRLGILFDDGTMLRRGGEGMDAATFPPDSQFEIFTDFILTLGAEIEARHNAEQEANP